jgi:hypothetical protein
MHCMPCCDFSGEQRSPIQLQQRIDELKKRFDFILRLNHGPRCPECGASANDGILCDGCLKLTEHCDCESRFTAPITWRVIK